MTKQRGGDIVIRPADGNDLEGVVRVGSSVMRATNAALMEPEVVDLLAAKFWTPAANTASIRAGRTFVGGAGPEGRDIVAMASYGREDGRAVIWKLYVLPEFQGLGLARRLVQTIAERLCGDVDAVYLPVHDGSDQALAFAHAIGFVEVEREEQSGMPQLIWLCRDVSTGSLA